MKALPVLCTIGTFVLGAVAGCQTLTTAEQPTSSPTASNWLIDPSPTDTGGTDLGTVTVDTVVDGDTIRATVNGRDERIRLLGIDAPELARDGKPAEKCAEDAKRFLTG